MKRILLSMAVFGLIHVAHAQGCLNAPNEQYPEYIYTPTCSGNFEIITDGGFSGEYSKVNVQAGITYEFKSSKASDYITISDENGQEVLNANLHQVVWTADQDRVIRFYVHTNANCGSDYDEMKIRAVKCSGTVIDSYCQPILDCTDGATILNVNFGGLSNPSNCGINGYNDFSSQTAVVAKGVETPIAVQIGYGWTEESVSMWIDYNHNFLFEENEFYYIGNGTNQVLNGTVLIPTSIPNGNYRMRLRLSTVGSQQATWDKACDVSQYYGETEDYTIQITDQLALQEQANTWLKIYPNPVMDLLTIESKQRIKEVKLYTLNGQLLNEFGAVQSISMKHLHAGVYVVEITNELGVKQNLKVVKK